MPQRVADELRAVEKFDSDDDSEKPKIVSFPSFRRRQAELSVEEGDSQLHNELNTAKEKRQTPEVRCYLPFRSSLT